MVLESWSDFDPLSTSCNVVLAFFFMVTRRKDCEGLQQATKKLVLAQQWIAVTFKFIFSILLQWRKMFSIFVSP